MLSIEECKRILLANQEEDQELINYSKEDIIFLRESISQLINIEFDYYQNVSNETTCNTLPKGIN